VAKEVGCLLGAGEVLQRPLPRPWGGVKPQAGHV